MGYSQLLPLSGLKCVSFLSRVVCVHLDSEVYGHCHEQLVEYIKGG